MCRSDPQGGRRCPSPNDPILIRMHAARRRQRDNLLLAARARAEGRRKDAARYTAHAAKALAEHNTIRDSVPPGHVTSVELVNVTGVRARKALLDSLVAEGVVDGGPYQSQWRAAKDFRNDAIGLARDARGRLVGVSGLQLMNGGVTVHDMWVIEDAQRTGAGTELMAQAANQATQMGKYGEVSLHVTNALSDAQAFYERCGARFEEKSQQGWWDDQQVIYDLALRARTPGLPPKPVITHEEVRAKHLDSWGRRLRNQIKRVRAEGGSRYLDPYELDETYNYGVRTAFPELTVEQVVAELRARRVFVAP